MPPKLVLWAAVGKEGEMKEGGFLSIVILLLSLLATPGWAESGDSSRINFFVEPILQKGFGGTSYDLSADEGSGITGLSRLEFPQLALEAGAVVGVAISRGEERQWLFEAGIAHSTFAISGTMKDYDWTLYPGYPQIPWSYTYSNDSTTSWHASFEAAWTFVYAKPFSLALYGTYRYQSMSHVEDNAIGWQYVFDPTTNEFQLYGLNIQTPDVLEYTLTSHTVGLGFLADLQGFPGFTLELRAAYAPVYMSDSDNHVLRTKLSTASGWGNGFYGNLRATYQFGQVWGFAPYIALEGELIYWVVNTTQTQYWYGNNDAANGAPEGTILTGIGHVVTSDQYQIGLRFGFMF